MNRVLAVFLLVSIGLFALEPKYFPGLPANFLESSRCMFLTAGDWHSDADISFRTEDDGLVVDCRAAAYNGSKAENSVRCPVPASRYVLVTFKYHLLKTMPCAEANVLFRFYDKDGRQVRECGLGLAQHLPPEKQGWLEECVELPEGTKSASAELYFYGNPMTVKVVDCQMSAAEGARIYQNVFPGPSIYSIAPLSDEELTARLQARGKRTTSVRSNGDLVEYCVDGKPVPLKIYKNTPSTTVASQKDHLKKTPYMMEAGFNLFTVTVEFGVPCRIRSANTVWLGEGEYQIEVIQKAMRELLKYAPDADVLLELCLSPHPGWAEAHQDDIVQYSDGRKAVLNGTRIKELTNEPPENYVPNKREPWTMSYWVPSYYSATYKKDLCKALTDVFAMLEKIPEANALAGVFLDMGIDGQWFDLWAEIPATATSPAIYPLADYSPAAQNYFRNFLKAKYGNSIEALQTAWNSRECKSFEEITIPAYEELFPQDDKVVIRKYNGRDKVSDFMNATSTGLAELYTSCCKAIKDGSGRRFIVGGYKTDGAIVTWPFIGHNCTKLMCASPDVDFWASCPGGRTPNEPVTPYLLNGSMRMHGKLGISELDFRSPWNGNWGGWGEPIYYKTHDEKEFQQRTMRAQLWANAFGGAFHAYDMDGFWYDTPMARKAWQNNNRLYDQRSAGKLDTDRIALIYSEHYWDYLALNGNRAFAHIIKAYPRKAATLSGTIADNYLLEDVFDEKFPAPKVLCFVTAPEMTENMANEIRRKFGNSGRVIVWMFAPGFGVTDNVSKVAGFNLKRVPQADGKPIVALEGSSCALLSGVSGILMAAHQPYPLGPAWAVEDQDAVVLGKYYQTDYPAMAMKQHDGYTEIYIGQGGAMTPALMRNIAELAGVHCWNRSFDPVAKAGNLLYVSAASTGKKSIVLPKSVSKVKCLSGHSIKQRSNIVTCNMEYGEVLVLKLEK